MAKDIIGAVTLFLLLAIYLLIYMAVVAGSNTAIVTVIIFLSACLVSCLFSQSFVPALYWFPLYLSAFQNVLLGFFINDFSESILKIVLVLNYLGFVFLYVIIFNVAMLRRDFGYPMIYLVFIAVYSVLIFGIMGGSPEAAFSSFRNLSAMYLFFIVGWCMAKYNNIKTIQSLKAGLILIFSLVFIFGFIERFIYIDTWHDLNLSELWLKKGLNIQVNGMPGNFYASEKINGEYVRRMVSSYADPINLGSNLFLFYLLAWYFGSKVIQFLSLVMMVLAFSKGALMGMLVFLVFYMRQKFGRNMYVLMGGAAVTVGALFLIWAFKNDANSVFAHISGFTSALKTLFTKPLGYGLGNVGVLAGLFGIQANEDITETGLGLIIGQLGIVGLIIFIHFFVMISKSAFGKSTNLQSRENLLLRAAMFGILLNIIFNEVALSPNSCAGYFLLMGMLVYQEKNKQLKDCLLAVE